jgi:4,5-dihydroxyphthalate decarboxylase
MASLPLSIAYNFYDRNAAISDGRVVPAGTAPTITHVPLGELFASMITEPTFDVSEMSLSSYVVARARGDRRLTAIPVFLSRAFRANSIYVRDGDVTRPEELKGRRVGVPMYQQTAGVWARGMLQDEHGLDLDSVTWCAGAVASMGGEERQPLNLPDHVRLERLPQGLSLGAALENGDISAIISPLVPPEFRKPDSRIRRLFPDYGRRDRDYYAKTGLFPVMHAVVIRTEVYEANPWLARSLFDAFTEAKEIALEGLADVSFLRSALPFVASLLEEQLEIFGDNPWSYGFAENRECLEVFMRYMAEQGLLEHATRAEDLFADVTA